MTCLMEADVAPLVATLPIDLGREYISGLLRSYRRLVVALGGLFMPGLLSVRPLPIGQRPISFPFWGQCISLISLVMSNDTCEPSLAFTMATCLTMTGFRAASQIAQRGASRAPFLPALRIDAIATAGKVLSLLHLEGGACTHIIYKLSGLMESCWWSPTVGDHQTNHTDNGQLRVLGGSFFVFGLG